MRVLFRMLSSNLSRSQLIGFVLSNLVGLVILMLAFQFYRDVTTIMTGDDAFMGKDYIIVSKRAGAGLGGDAGFSQAETEDLAMQKFCISLCQFVSSSFKVSATLGVPELGISFTTDMFFESVGDEFVDFSSSDWSYREGDDIVPIVLPRDYLNMYNYGFAQARNMPRLTEGIISMLSIDLRISGNGTATMKGRVVGFSSRLNTILVPQSFMDYANQRYGTGNMTKPSRLVVEVSNPADAALAQYFKDNGYETDADRLQTSQTAWVLKMLVSVVMCIGLVISLLAIYILLLSIFLLVEKNVIKIESLLLLGYSAGCISMPYVSIILVLNIAVWILSSLAVVFIRQCYVPFIQDVFENVEMSGVSETLMLGLGVVAVLGLADSVLIMNKIKRIIKR